MTKKSISKTNRTCQEEGCNREYCAKGYCKKHWQQIYRSGKILKRTIHDRNEIAINGDIAEVVLYNSKSEEIARTVIDVEDVNKVKSYKWCLCDGYAKTGSGSIPIQNVIMGTMSSHKKMIDHRDQDRLNNRKSNYGFCTKAENAQNSKKRKNNTSGYKGVTMVGGKWVAQIGISNKLIYLGIFKKKLDAAIAYNKAAIEYFGDFACLN